MAWYMRQLKSKLVSPMSASLLCAKTFWVSRLQARQVYSLGRLTSRHLTPILTLQTRGVSICVASILTTNSLKVV